MFTCRRVGRRCGGCYSGVDGGEGRFGDSWVGFFAGEFAAAVVVVGFGDFVLAAKGESALGLSRAVRGCFARVSSWRHDGAGGRYWMVGWGGQSSGAQCSGGGGLVVESFDDSQGLWVIILVFCTQ